MKPVSIKHLRSDLYLNYLLVKNESQRCTTTPTYSFMWFHMPPATNSSCCCLFIGKDESNRLSFGNMSWIVVPRISHHSPSIFEPRRATCFVWWSRSLDNGVPSKSRGSKSKKTFSGGLDFFKKRILAMLGMFEQNSGNVLSPIGISFGWSLFEGTSYTWCTPTRQLVSCKLVHTNISQSPSRTSFRYQISGIHLPKGGRCSIWGDVRNLLQLHMKLRGSRVFPFSGRKPFDPSQSKY